MTIGVNAQFDNGHVIALPASVADASTNTVNSNGALPPTTLGSPVASPILRFTTLATTTGASNISHVVGYAQKLQVRKSTFEPPNTQRDFTFPIGDGTYFRPLTMFDPSNSLADWTARYLSIDPVTNTTFGPSRTSYTSPLNGRVSDKEFWYLTSSASVNTSFTLDYLHPNSTIAESNYYRVDKWAGMTIAGMGVNNNNIAWKDLAGSPTFPGPGGGTVSTTSAMNNNAWFTIARRDQSPLPVRLVSFSAKQIDGQVQLKWQSAEEKKHVSLPSGKKRRRQAVCPTAHQESAGQLRLPGHLQRH
jgi:hypothetical protein